MSIAVHTEVFEGPFDLLLHLILRDQVDLYEVSLSAIVDAYVDEIERMKELDLNVATEFLLIAATLVELKARRLLPGPDDLDIDDEFSLWEERDLLLTRLLECKTFKDASVVFEDLEAIAALSLPRVAGLEEPFVGLAPDPLSGLAPTRLRDVMVELMRPKEIPTVNLDHVTPIRISVADAVAYVEDELQRAKRTTFSVISRSSTDRVETIVRFLAVLELLKRGALLVSQPETFGEIHLEWVGYGAGAGVKLEVDAYQG